ncbi:MAG: AAA family ATPase [Desulfobulbaceae bacterium]|nr:AAA family ATPase [Desulfobulbaceae bacterium]
MKTKDGGSLFDFSRQKFLSQNGPLADRMRPRCLDDFVGQERIVGPGRLLRRAIRADQLSSLILYGPPGSGKTTLARIIANTTKADFITLNAVLSGVKDIREAIDRARNRLGAYSTRTILFIDEVHRFNKVQQDALLPHVENGTVIFIGATTENPYFEVNKALLSRSRVFELTSLDNQDLLQIAKQALADPERGYGQKHVQPEDGALEHLVEMANGDARALLNALELAVQTTEPDEEGKIIIDQRVAEESIQKRAVLYDKDGDAHYDVISAFIKSVRGSDPDAALYWLAKMVYAGEDPRFIFRRMLILASEDVGMADPQALQVVMSAAQTYDYVGMPEGRFALAHACVYLATAPKSNSLFAFFTALESVAKEKEGEVPNHLKDASRDGEDLGHGRDYLYPHAYRDHWVAQQYLPTSLQGRVFYQPSSIGYEEKIKNQVDRTREEQLAVFLEQRAAEANMQNEKFFGDHLHTPGRIRNQWLKRTLEGSGKRLGEIRDTMYRLSGCQRDSLVLVLEDPTGLLTWEGVRHAPMGAVYSLLKDGEVAGALRARVANLEVLERPRIVEGSLDILAELVAEEKGLRFDVLLARGMRSTLEANRDCLTEVSQYIVPSGRLVFSEVLPRWNQRLYKLLPEGCLSPEVVRKLSEAEEAIYRDSELDWCEPGSLQKLFSAPTCKPVEIIRETVTSDTHISRADVENWFTPRGKGEKKSYSLHLAQTMNKHDIELVKRAFQSHLADRVVSWSSLVVYCVLSKL